MDSERFLRQMEADASYRGQIAHVARIPSRAARFADTSLPLDRGLSQRLAESGIRRLYTHQAAAIDAARRGDHVVVVTGTASGKTLCYNVPVVESILSDPGALALYLFPTKALAHSQLAKLSDLGVSREVRFATYDGDTPRAERPSIRRGVHIVLTNPDMLHVGVLPNHSQWARFFEGLRYIVVDELHSYRGVFGSHVAQILRRLRRICAHYGANPTFIATSATIGNPAGHFRALTGLDAFVIDDDGAPSAARTFVFWNPPMLGPVGGRRSSHVEATGLFTALVRSGIRTLTFARARKSAELILKYTREAFREDAGLSERVTAYRAGYTPEQRRAIEQGLLDGRLMGVAATNALELGIDIGDLDATVLTGYPGTIASTWQQAGRSGRKGGQAISFLVAMDDPLDQYLMRHPEYVLERGHERAVINPSNPRIQAAHLLCAAHELPLAPKDLDLFGVGRDRVAALQEEDRLLWRNERWYARGDRSPAAGVSIRSASSDSYEIRDKAGALLGTVDSSRVYQTVHPGAIYLHQGETYLVRRLDESERVAIVEPTEAAHYTEPREWVSISVLAERGAGMIGDVPVRFGEVAVSSQVLGYRVRQLYSDAVLDMVDLDLSEQSYRTEALWLALPERAIAEIDRHGADLCGTIHAAEHALIGVMPLLSMCDRWDVGGVSSPNHPDTGGPAIFIYDGYPGGVGIAESTYGRLRELLVAAAECAESCPCADGCPSCVQSPKCGTNNDPLDKRGAAILLKLMALSRESGFHAA